MELATTLQFTQAVRHLSRATRQLGLKMPAFRCPPSIVGIDRTLRRRPDGGAVVAVRIKGRPMAAVHADMIEGVLAANRLRGVEADHARARLWGAVAVDGPVVYGHGSAPARVA